MVSFFTNGILSLISAIIHQFSLYPLFMMFLLWFHIYIMCKKNQIKIKINFISRWWIFYSSNNGIMYEYMLLFWRYGRTLFWAKISNIIRSSFNIFRRFFIYCFKKFNFWFFINNFFGIGFAIAMTAAVKNASKDFPNKKGLINALSGGFGGNLGSSFFNLIINIASQKEIFQIMMIMICIKWKQQKIIKIFFIFIED